MLLESGDYFLDKENKKDSNKKIRKKIQIKENEEKEINRKKENFIKRNEEKNIKKEKFKPPIENDRNEGNKIKKNEPTLDELKEKFLGKKHKKM